MYRQGDVLLVPTKSRKSLFCKPTIKFRGRVILARGEKEGHTHVLENATVYELFGKETIVVDEPTPLVHQEHETIMIPAGEYEVIQQREYVPQERPRKVYD